MPTGLRKEMTKAEACLCLPVGREIHFEGRTTQGLSVSTATVLNYIADFICLFFVARPDDPVGRVFWPELVPNLFRDGTSQTIIPPV